MSKPEERFVLLRVPEDSAFVDDVDAEDFAIIASQSDKAQELIQRPADAESTWHPSKVTSEIAGTTRLITLNDALCEKALNAFEGVKAPRDFEDMRAALRVAFGEEGK